jgi:DNA-binding CsgD family transcriptional regulator
MTATLNMDSGVEHMVFDAMEAAHAAQDLDALTEVFAKAFGALGSPWFATYALLDPGGHVNGAFSAGRNDPIWRDRYVSEHLFSIDPIAQRLPHTLDMIFWSDLQKETALTAPQSAIFAEAGSCGHSDGFAVPLHRLDGGLSVTVVTTPMLYPQARRWRVGLSLLAHAFTTGVRQLQPVRAPANSVRLSRRQTECLQWVRAGKSDWEIGEILGISEHTVSEHIETARRKLGVRTRTQAVIEALSRGMISL